MIDSIKSFLEVYEDSIREKTLIDISGAPPAREARERGRSPVAKEMW